MQEMSWSGKLPSLSPNTDGNSTYKMNNGNANGRPHIEGVMLSAGRWLSQTLWEADEQQQQRLALASISARGQKTYCAQGASRMGGKRPVCTELTLIPSSRPTQACFLNNALLQLSTLSLNKGGVFNKSSALITAGKIHHW